MPVRLAIAIAAAFSVGPSLAADVTYTKDIAPLFKQACGDCHGSASPHLDDFKKDEKRFVKEKTGPKMDTYGDLVAFVVWPDTGALMRRLDDGKASPEGKPGNMYRFLGSDEAERQKNLALVKNWVGEGGWNLNRWKARGDVPAITKDQLDKVKLKY